MQIFRLYFKRAIQGIKTRSLHLDTSFFALNCGSCNSPFSAETSGICLVYKKFIEWLTFSDLLSAWNRRIPYNIRKFQLKFFWCHRETSLALAFSNLKKKSFDIQNEWGWFSKNNRTKPFNMHKELKLLTPVPISTEFLGVVITALQSCFYCIIKST